MGERNVYIEPEDRVLLRTADVYQTDAVDDVDSYSETLLSVVANFNNSGCPENANAQSMVGKSKKGEVACRLFAEIDSDTQIVREIGFKSRGCLAMTGAASIICKMIEGKDIAEITDIDPEEVREALDGVPPGKINTLYFAPCAVRALVGDFLIRQGATLEEINESLPCNESSIECIMAEHCSLRTSRIELQVKEQEEKDRILENNAIADAIDNIRANSAQGKLSTPNEWEERGIRPAHLSKRKFNSMISEMIEDEKESESTAGSSASPHKAKQSQFANRGVGIPKTFSQTDKQPMPETVRTIKPNPNISNKWNSQETFDDLSLPEGCTLEELNGEWVLVQHETTHIPKMREIDTEGIKKIESENNTYYFDGNIMTDNFAHWAFLAAEDDPVATFAYCVRQESETYPRPMALTSFANEPLNMDAKTVEKAFCECEHNPAMSDIKRTKASNGDIYFYSNKHLSTVQADALAEYDAVERVKNV